MPLRQSSDFGQVHFDVKLAANAIEKNIQGRTDYPGVWKMKEKAMRRRRRQGEGDITIN